MKFNIVVAVDKNHGIGKNNALPWHLPADLKQFKKLTSSAIEGKRNAVIMGRKTWDSLPEKFRPLPARLNVVISRSAQLNLPNGCNLANSLDEALKICDTDKSISEIFVIGGAELYKIALQHRALGKIYLTALEKNFECDVFFPEISENLKISDQSEKFEENGISYTFKILEPEIRQLTNCQVD